MSATEHTKAKEASDTPFNSFHYAPRTWNSEEARRWSATSVYMPYPKLSSQGHDLLDESILYDLFTIPSLRHVTLHHCTELSAGWHRDCTSDQERQQDDGALSHAVATHERGDPHQGTAGTSNVEYLAIKETSRNYRNDLGLLVLWPKALKEFDGIFGSKSDTDPLKISPWDASQIPRLLIPQRMSLQQLRLDVTYRTKTFGTFGTTLHEFPNLKRLTVPRNFLARLAPDFWFSPDKVETGEHQYTDTLFKDVYLALPPALEELIVNVDADLERVHRGREDEIGHAQKWLRDVASHKTELYSSLQRLVLWQSPPAEKGRTIEDREAWEKKIIGLLNVSADYTAAGIELVFVEADAAPDFSNHRSHDYSDVFESNLTIPGHGYVSPQLTTAVRKRSLGEGARMSAEVLRLEPDGQPLSLFHCSSANGELSVINAEHSTTICVPYSDLATHLDESTGFEILQSLFGIPSLKAVVLYGYTSVFRGNYSGKLSNLEHLSVKATPRENDLQLENLLQIPRALKVLDCTLGYEMDYIDTELPFDPSQIPRMLKPQEASLEQISFDLVGGRTSTYGTFGTNLRAFTKLKRLAVPQNFLSSSSLSPTIVLSEADDDFHLDYSMDDIYQVLPPSIEELVLNVEGDLKSAQYSGATDLHPQFRDWVRDIAVHKQALYPSLQRVVLWLEPIEKRTHEAKLAFEMMVTDFLGLSRDFEDAGIMLEFHETDSVPQFTDWKFNNDFLDLGHGLKNSQMSQDDTSQHQQSLDCTPTSIDTAKVFDPNDPFRRKFHYAPGVWDARTARIPAVLRATSACMPMPVLTEAEIERKDNSIYYDLFAIPSLRHVTLSRCSDYLYQLHVARWKLKGNVEEDPDQSYPDDSKARTSSVECLRIRENPEHNEEHLSQLMVWPKALRVFDCTFALEHEVIVANKDWPWDPSQLPSIMFSQRTSLEQISVDLLPHRTATLGTLGTSLRHYPSLKRLSLPRNFLASIKDDEYFRSLWSTNEVNYWDLEHSHVHTALPPALEELVLNVDKDLGPANFDVKYRLPVFRQWVRDIALHKQELYPGLRGVVLWQAPSAGGHVEGKIEKAKWEWNVMERLDLKDEFKDAGIELEFKLTDVVPQFAHNELCM